MRIRGETSIDYFLIRCEKCGQETKNKYLGGDPAVPHFEAKCEKCKTEVDLKFSNTRWEGLPYKV